MTDKELEIAIQNGSLTFSQAIKIKKDLATISYDGVFIDVAEYNYGTPYAVQKNNPENIYMHVTWAAGDDYYLFKQEICAEIFIDGYKKGLEKNDR